MLDRHHLEQHHRIDAGASIILAIERLHHFIQTCEVHRCIYLSQQMLLRHQLVYDYELYQISIHFPAFQHLSSPLPILPYLSEKAQLQPDFFDRLRNTILSDGVSFCDRPQVLLPVPPHIARKRVGEGETFASFPTRVQSPARTPATRKAPKCRLRRMKRGGFEEVSRLPRRNSRREAADTTVSAEECAKKNYHPNGW